MSNILTKVEVNSVDVSSYIRNWNIEETFGNASGLLKLNLSKAAFYSSILYSMVISTDFSDTSIKNICLHGTNSKDAGLIFAMLNFY